MGQELKNLYPVLDDEALVSLQTTMEGIVYQPGDTFDTQYDRYMEQTGQKSGMNGYLIRHGDDLIYVGIALLVVAALAFGIVKWVGYIRGNSSSAPIEGVTESLYEDGIALVKSHVTSDYINDMIGKFTTDGMLRMSSSFEEASAAIQALTPEKPAANDATFIDALEAIQDNIVSAITMDALAVGSTSETAASTCQRASASCPRLSGCTRACLCRSSCGACFCSFPALSPRCATAWPLISWPRIPPFPQGRPSAAARLL
jgi:hypothetical protein